MIQKKLSTKKILWESNKCLQARKYEDKNENDPNNRIEDFKKDEPDAKEEEPSDDVYDVPILNVSILPK